MGNDYKTWANIDISGNENSLPEMLVGAAINPKNSLVAHNRLYVQTISQESLDNINSAYNHSQAKINKQWAKIKKLREELLRASDKTQLLDYPLASPGILSKLFFGEEDKVKAWKIYRQQLRDITQQPDPFNIIWPQVPE